MDLSAQFYLGENTEEMVRTGKQDSFVLVSLSGKDFTEVDILWTQCGQFLMGHLGKNNGISFAQTFLVFSLRFVCT